MRRLWKELRYFIGQLRCDYPRQKEIEAYYTLVRPMMSLELKPYTFVECVTTAYSCGVPLNKVSDVACSLYARSNRGTVDMREIHDILTRLYIPRVPTLEEREFNWEG
ncbi:hypothetical protein KAR91_65545 [Candidatus Pacearchaeota archaeon]|nr:hypothetical protein [Candidatus Pacearchaeota archaeon]